MTDKEKIDKLTQLKSNCYNCQKCELHKGKFNVLSDGSLKTITPKCFGAGNANADIMVVAEAPGEHEAIEKRPLIGLAGHNFDPRMARGGKNSFEGIKYRDEVKNYFAMKNAMKLIRIKYSEFDEIEEILKRNIN